MIKRKDKILYLSSEYPAISHTFIYREIITLREMGFDISTASVNRTNLLSIMSAEEQEEACNTLVLKDNLLVSGHLNLIKLFMTCPLGFFSMLISTIQLVKRYKEIIRPTAYFLEAAILVNSLKKLKIGHIHVHFGNPAAIVAMIASRINGISYSLSIHGSDIFYNIDRNILTEKFTQAERIRCISSYTRSQVQRLIPYEQWKKVQVVRCGVDLDIFDSRPVPENDNPQILFLGRLVSSKGIHILIESIHLLALRNISCELMIVGDGEHRKDLENLSKTLGIEHLICFAGAVGHDEVHQYYNKADIFVLPSFAEGIPIVLMEAMAKEIASISTGINGIPELISSGSDGILVIPSEVDVLAEELGNLVMNRKERSRLGKQGRKKVMQHYDIRKNCLEMIDFFERC